MSTIGGSHPTVPLSSFLNPTAVSPQAAAVAPTATTDEVPAPAEIARGFSAVTFGLTPPRTGGATEADLELVRQVLEQLRANSDDNTAVNKAQEKVGRLNAAASSLAALAENIDRLVELEGEIATQAAVVASAQGAVDTARGKVTTTEGKISDTAGKIADTVDKMEATDATINDLSAQIAKLVKDGDPDKKLPGLRSQLAAAEATLGTLTATLRTLNATLASLKGELVTQKADLATKEATLATEQAELTTLTNEQATRIAAVIPLLLVFLAFLFFLPGFTPEGDNGPLLQEALGKLVSPEGRSVLSDILNDLRDIGVEVEQAIDAIDSKNFQLDEVRQAKVSLAFGAIYTSLTDALTALARLVDDAGAATDGFSGNAGGRVRLAIGGAA